MPRSGTTLVEQILGSHGRVFAGGELGHIPRMWGRLTAWEHRLGSGFQKIPDCALELTREQSIAFARIVEEEYRDLIPSGNWALHITDKLPHNFKNIGMIKLLFPRAKIIYCRRESGAIALSNFFTDYVARHGGMGFAYDLAGIGHEIANCRRLMAHWISLFTDAVHVVDYETLVDQPESTVKAMLDYLGLSWDPGVMRFHDLKRPVKTASVHQVRQPLYKGAKERWRHYEKGLSPMFEALAHREAEGMPESVPLPDHEPSLFLKGMERLKANQHSEAEYIFKDLLEIYPRHAAAMHMLGAVYSGQGKVRAARHCMERSIRLHPGNPTWYSNLAIIMEQMREPENAQNMREKGEKVAWNTGYVPQKF